MTYSVKLIDVSRFQAEDPDMVSSPKKMDWQRALDAGTSGAIIRCGRGTYEDWTYDYNRAECERLKIPYGVYHVWYPGVDTTKQIDFFVERLAGSIYPTADCEIAGDISTSLRASRCREYLEGVATNRLPMIYTRANWWDQYIGTVSWASKYPLWVAHYGASVPTLPKSWTKWKFWQWSADGNGKGPEYGARSKSIDLNWYQGTLEEFAAEFGSQVSVPVPPTQEYNVCRLVVDTLSLNIRTGPGTHYPDVGDLHSGDVVEALNFAGQDVWIEISPGKWACACKSNFKYMRMQK